MDGSSHKLVLLHITKSVTLPGLEDDAWRSDELTYNDSFRAVDDKGALLTFPPKHGIDGGFAVRLVKDA